MDLFKPKLSLNGVQLDLPSITEEETSDATEVTSADWLVLAEESIQRDLDASVKELDLIHDVLEDLEIQLRSEEKPNLELEDQKFLMAACQEYSGSRCHMLEERLRQIMLWLSTKKTGGKIPDRVPDEWSTVDDEWRQWLSEQAVPQGDELGQSSTEYSQNEGVHDAVKDWGPLIPLLAAYTE